jgi:uncharacterized membrane protein YfcA
VTSSAARSSGSDERVTWPQALIGVLVGFVSGILSGLFGVGGGIVMTPGIQVLMGASPIVALATPLPVILPTAVTGALRYRRAGELDLRAAGWMASLGLVGAAVGAGLTKVVPTHLLLVVTAALLAWQSIGILRGASREQGEARLRATPITFATIGLIAGLVSGLLGIGGGIVMVPLMAGWLGMPLKRVLGTSLATIVVLVIPGTIVHAVLGHIDWTIFLVVVLGAVPGARIGASLALGTRERTLRTWVGSFMLVVAALYGVDELWALLRR